MKTASAGRTRRSRQDSAAISLELERSPDGRLIVVRDTGDVAVSIGRCFPWSEPMAFLSLRDDDGNEIAMIADPGELSPGSRAALDRALADADFVLRVNAVMEVREEVELRDWRVSTEQGGRRFQTRLDDWPRTLPDGGLLIRDITGDLYRLPEVATMDRRSRSLLWAFVD